MNENETTDTQLSAYLDGELDEAQLRQVEEALEADADLRKELAELAAARKLLRDLQPARPTVDLVARVLAEAERNQLVGAPHEESKPHSKPWIRYAATAAVLLVAASVGMIIAVTLSSVNPGPSVASHQSPSPTLRGKDGDVVATTDGKRRDEDLTRDGPVLGRNAALAKGSGLGRSKKVPGGTSFNNGSLFAKPGFESGAPSVSGVLTKAGGTLNGPAANAPAQPSGKGSGGSNWDSTVDGTMAKNKVVSIGNVNGSSPFASNVADISRALSGNLTDNEIIYTDRLEATRQQVEKVLAANGVAALVTRQPAPDRAEVKDSQHLLSQARGNFYTANRLSPAQVQLEAYVTPEQMAKVQKALDGLRARQRVSQEVPALALADSKASKDFGLEYRGRRLSSGHKSYKKKAEKASDEAAKADLESKLATIAGPANSAEDKLTIAPAPNAKPQADDPEGTIHKALPSAPEPASPTKASQAPTRAVAAAPPAPLTFAPAVPTPAAEDPRPEPKPAAAPVRASAETGAHTGNGDAITETEKAGKELARIAQNTLTGAAGAAPASPAPAAEEQLKTGSHADANRELAEAPTTRPSAKVAVTAVRPAESSPTSGEPVAARRSGGLAKEPSPLPARLATAEKAPDETPRQVAAVPSGGEGRRSTITNAPPATQPSPAKAESWRRWFGQQASTAPADDAGGNQTVQVAVVRDGRGHQSQNDSLQQGDISGQARTGPTATPQSGAGTVLLGVETDFTPSRQLGVGQQQIRANVQRLVITLNLREADDQANRVGRDAANRASFQAQSGAAAKRAAAPAESGSQADQK